MDTKDSQISTQHLKSILKGPSQVNRKSASRKTAKFDELNVLATLNPLGRSFNILRENGDKTTYTYDMPDVEQSNIDIQELKEKLRQVANIQTPSFGDENLSDDEFPETDEEKIHRLEFERRRKAHYKEYHAVQMARKLIQDELVGMEDDDDYDEDKNISIEVSNIEVSTSLEMEPEVEKSSKEEIDNDSETDNDETTDSVAEQQSTHSNEADQIVPPSHPCYGKILRPK